MKCLSSPVISKAKMVKSWCLCSAVVDRSLSALAQQEAQKQPEQLDRPTVFCRKELPLLRPPYIDLNLVVAAVVAEHLAERNSDRLISR